MNAEVTSMFFIYKIIGTEWRNLNDEELCGAADTLENAELLIDAMNILDEAHREIRTVSGEVVLLNKQKYYIYYAEITETGYPMREVFTGMSDTLKNARSLIAEMSKKVYYDYGEEKEGILKDNVQWIIRDIDGNIVE